MAGSNQGDPSELFAKGLSFITEAAKLFGSQTGAEVKSEWSAVTDRVKPRTSAQEPSATEQRENLAFALATRAVEALEDIALNTAAIRQRLGGADVLNPVNKPAARPDLSAERPDGLFND